MSSRDTSSSMTFGQVIRQRRTELGLTQEALAELVGDKVRQADISRLERDYISMPRRSRLEALAQALEVSPGYLLMKSGWFFADDDDARMATGDVMIDSVTPEASLGPALDAHESPATHRLPTGETAAASHALHEALVHARELSQQTRDVLTRSASIVKQAGRARSREA